MRRASGAESAIATSADPLAVVAYPVVAASDAARIDAIRRAHDPQHARIAAHVTLLFPTRGLDLARAADRLRGAASEQAPFAVALRTVASFHERDASYVFLLPDPGATAFARLHARLSDGLAGSARGDAPPYRPHLTLARMAERDAADALARRLAADWRPIASRVDALVLLRVAPAGPVVEIERAALAGR
jgi:2'-5' RNA ligase